MTTIRHRVRAHALASAALLGLAFALMVATAHAAPPDATDAPISVVAIWQVVPGCEAEMTAALGALADDWRRAPGHLATAVLAPAAPHDGRFQAVGQFDGVEAWQRWRDGAAGARLLARLARFSDGAPVLLHGRAAGDRAAAWFRPPPEAARPKRPDPVKRGLVTWLTIYPLVLGASAIVNPLLVTAPSYLRVLVMTMVMVPTMTLAVVPQLNHLFADWLYAPPPVCPVAPSASVSAAVSAEG